MTTTEPITNGKAREEVSHLLPFAGTTPESTHPTDAVPSENKSTRRMRLRRDPANLATNKTRKLDRFQIRRQYRADKAEAREQHHQRTARAKQRRLTDTNAALAAVYRTRHALQAFFAITALGGVLWTSRNVAVSLGGPEPSWVYYLVEPLFSFPLLGIVLLQSLAASFNRLHEVTPFAQNAQGKLRPTGIGWVEAGLMVGTVLISSWPAITAPDPSFQDIAARVCAPLLIVASAVAQLLVARVTSSIILQLTTDDSDAETVRERASAAVDKAVDALRLYDTGVWSTYPSKNQLQKELKGQSSVLLAATDLIPKIDALRKRV